MADRKITELTNITGANLADGDEFVVVDASADETKALTFAELTAALQTSLDDASGFVRITGDTMSGSLKITDLASIGLGAGIPASFGSGVPTVVFQGTAANGRAGALNFREYAASGDGAITSQIYSTDGSDGYGFVLNAQQGLLKLNTGGLTNTALAVDQSQRVLIGSTSGTNSVTPLNLKVSSGGVGGNNIVIGKHGASNYQPAITTVRSRGTEASPSSVAAFDGVAAYNSYGYDGSNYIWTGGIQLFVDGTPGTNDMPSRLALYTTADGASSASERMRIENTGTVNIGSISSNRSNSALSIYRAGTGYADIRTTSNYGVSLKLAGASDNTDELRLTQDNSKNGYLYNEANKPLSFGTNNTERVKITDIGRFVSTKGQILSKREDTDFTSFGSFIVAEGHGEAGALGATRYQANQYASYIRFVKSRGATPSSRSSVADNDQLGYFQWLADDGTDTNSSAAMIRAEVDGTPGTDDMPGRLMFFTTSDGSSGPSERVRINSEGKVGIGTTDPSTPRRMDVVGSSSNGYSTGASINDNVVARFRNGSDSSTAKRFGGISLESGNAQFAINTIQTGTYGGDLAIKTRTGSSSYSEALRIDDQRRLLLGHTSSPGDIWGGQENKFQIIGNSWENSGMSLLNYQGGTTAASINFSKSRNSTVGTSGGLVSNNDRLGYINFTGDDGTDQNSVGASIDVSVDGTPGNNDMPARIVFKTTSDGTSASTERMRIDSSGNLLVGKTSSNTGSLGAEFRPDGLGVFGRSADYPLILNRTTSDGGILLFRKDSSAVGSIGVEGADLTIGNGDVGLQFVPDFDAIRPMNMSTNAIRDAAIDLGRYNDRFKNLYLSGGVYLGGTGSANYLDDYEEGSWTPQVYYQDATDQANATNTVQAGKYVKMGALVFVQFRLDFSQSSSSPANNNIGVKNLPFAAAHNHYGATGNLITNSGVTGINFQTPSAGTTLAVLSDSANGGNYGDNFGSGSGKFIRGSFTYLTS